MSKKLILQPSICFTFDDVLLKPDFSNVLPASANTKTKITNNISLEIPIISAAMDTVTESRLAIAMAQNGGIGCIHKNFTIKEQAEEVRKVKRFESGMVLNPVTISHNATLLDALELLNKNFLFGTFDFLLVIY